MNQKVILKTLAMLTIGVLFAVANPARVEAQGVGGVGAGTAARDVAGSYLALLDLTPLGFGPRIETLGMILDDDGSVVMTSEHEEDKESAGVGVWQHLGSGAIGIGVASFRLGPDPGTSICGVVGLTSPPDNCFLKVGGVLVRADGGGLVGELLLTVETLDGATQFVFPDPLPIAMRRLTLDEFPGALP